MSRIYKIITMLFLGLYLSLLLFYPSAESAPKLANYFLHNQITDAQARELAKWDLVILDMETQYTSPAQLTLLRKLNPSIVILAYITSEEIRNDAATQNWGPLRKKLAQGLDSSWYLKDGSGNRLSFWEGTSMLNVSSVCPSVNGVKFNQYLARFVSNEILGSGKWDGVFYDNGWEKLTWFTKNADLNNDGAADANLDNIWQAGMKELFDQTRLLTGGQYLVVTNGTSNVYRDQVNGIMSESFPAMDGWKGTMNIYYFQEQSASIKPRILIINANTGNTGNQNNYRAMRYGLFSTLLGNGYYSFDYGNSDHGQTWWYDEYNVNLGEPSGVAYSLNQVNNFNEDIWRRDYFNGVVLLNSTNQAQSVDLGGDFEKIKGTQDKTVNNGLIVDKVRLPARDGIMLLKIAKTLDEVVFSNGGLARFFDIKGNRARNGFFIFEEGLAGGAWVYRGDTKGDGSVVKVAVQGPRLTITNQAGGIWYNDYPLNPDLTDNLSLAIGYLSNTESKDIIVAAPQGGQVKVFNYYGKILKDKIYPLGNKYRGSFSLAIGNTDGIVGGEVVVGVGVGAAGEVLVFDKNLKNIKKRFFPFDKKYKDGILVACGDMNGDGKDEIITLQAKTKKPLVRIFDGGGKKLSEFYLTIVFSSGSYSLAAADVNFDGRDEVVVISE
ncbi:MAG: putative glycoside hydrolase [Candidatus Magasanikbacteria bacterium]